MKFNLVSSLCNWDVFVVFDEMVIICVWFVLKDVIEFLDPDHMEGK